MKSSLVEEKSRVEKSSKESREKSQKPVEIHRVEAPPAYSKIFNDIKRQPLKQKPAHLNESNLLKASEAESLEDICLKKYLEPKKKLEEAPRLNLR